MHQHIFRPSIRNPTPLPARGEGATKKATLLSLRSQAKASVRKQKLPFTNKNFRSQTKTSVHKQKLPFASKSSRSQVRVSGRKQDACTSYNL
jgi:hypothetical protein